LFAGADFGGGIWDLLAGTTRQGEQPRAAIDASVTPVWEGNHVWIVLGFVLVWTAFPAAFAPIMRALFVPLSLSLLGIVLRGVGFAFRHEAHRLRTRQLSGVLFAASSVIVPFFLGAVIGAVTTGRVRPDAPGNVPSAWLSTTPLLTGGLFLCACAYVAAVYLIGDSARRDDPDMVRYFSRRALVSGVLTGALAAVTLISLHRHAEYVFHRLLHQALPLVIVSVAAGGLALLLILLRRVWALRICAGIAVVAVVAGWGIAQYPYLLPGTLTLQQGGAPRSTLWAELAVVSMLVLLVVPGFAYLYWLHQHEQLQETEASSELRLAAAAEDSSPGRPGPAPDSRHGFVTAAVLAVTAVHQAIRRRAPRSPRP
jgi:cytochrome d ubiquinol oxidase subunit II